MLPFLFFTLSNSSSFDVVFFILSEGVDEYAVNKFLSEVFPADKSSCGKIRSLIKESASRRFDMKEEVFYSILIY